MMVIMIKYWFNPNHWVVMQWNLNEFIISDCYYQYQQLINQLMYLNLNHHNF